VTLKYTSPTTRICAMCQHWNGHKGGDSVQMRVGMMNVMQYDDREAKVCYKRSFKMVAWNSCNDWQRRF
jgi:hypothetical protein